MSRKKQILLMVVGVLSIILAIVMFSMDDGVYTSYRSYGGDAYTGIQHASADTATNVRQLIRVVRSGAGCILLVAGATLLVLGLPDGPAQQPQTEERPLRSRQVESPLQLEQSLPPEPAEASERPLRSRDDRPLRSRSDRPLRPEVSEEPDEERPLRSRDDRPLRSRSDRPEWAERPKQNDPEPPEEESEPEILPDL